MRNLEREIGTRVPQGRAPGGRVVQRQAAADARSPSRACASCSAARRFISEAKRRTRAAGRGDRAGVDAGRRRRALHRGHGVRRARASSTITGQLGDVMHESAQAALSYVRSHLARARPRRSTSTGSPSTTSTSTSRRARPRRTARAPASRWPPRSCRCSAGGRVRDDVAMTGEITLTGQVLPIGGLKEKALAAQRNGHRTHHRARRSTRRDIEDIPEHLRDDLEFVFVEEIGEVLDVALERGLGQRPQALACSRREPGIGSPPGQQATSGDRGMAAKKQAAKARSAADGGPAPMSSASSRTPSCARTSASRSRTPGSAYGRLTNGKPATKVLDDKKLHKDVQAGGRVAARRRLRPCARVPRRRSASGAASASCCSLGIIGAGVAIAPRARACATRSSTRSSAPRRSSTTPRPRRPRRGAGETVSAARSHGSRLRRARGRPPGALSSFARAVQPAAGRAQATAGAMEAAADPAAARIDGEKAQRIVEAMRSSVARRGVAGSTFDHVAREARRLARAAALLLRDQGAAARRGRAPRLRGAHGRARRAARAGARAPTTSSTRSSRRSRRYVARGARVHHASSSSSSRSRGATRRSPASSPSCCAARASTSPSCSRAKQAEGVLHLRAEPEAVADVLFALGRRHRAAHARRARPRLRADARGGRARRARAARLSGSA